MTCTDSTPKLKISQSTNMTSNAKMSAIQEKANELVAQMTWEVCHDLSNHSLNKRIKEILIHLNNTFIDEFPSINNHLWNQENPQNPNPPISSLRPQNPKPKIAKKKTPKRGKQEDTLQSVISKL